MNKLPICLLCRKRKVNQQVWKTEEEKKYCFTCNVFINFITQLQETLQSVVYEKSINCGVRISLILDNKSSAERKLTNAVFPQKGISIKYEN